MFIIFLFFPSFLAEYPSKYLEVTKTYSYINDVNSKFKVTHIDGTALGSLYNLFPSTISSQLVLSRMVLILTCLGFYLQTIENHRTNAQLQQPIYQSPLLPHKCNHPDSRFSRVPLSEVSVVIKIFVIHSAQKFVSSTVKGSLGKV